MSDARPVVYIIDAATAVTGAFIAARNEAGALKESARLVLVLPKGSAIPAAELNDFWRVEYLPIVNISRRIGALLCYLPALFFSAWRLRRLMKKDNATRLQLNDFYLMHGAVLRLLGFKGTIISWVRCNPRNFAGALAPLLLWCAQKTSDRFVAVSRFVQSLLPFSAECIYDYYTGTARAACSFGETEQKIFVYVGNYIPGKGQDVALRAFAIAAKEDATLRLAFYGSDMGLAKNRAYRDDLKTLAAQSGFSERISFGDFMRDTRPVLETAFAALNFSVSESFSMTVLEASGCGLPVIATASGGPQEIIADGITGHLIAVGDADAAARLMLKLAKNPAEATKMGEAGAAHVRQLFPVDQFRERLRALFALQ